MREAVFAMTTTNRAEEARSIAEVMVKERLAACVQIVPRIESVYEWDGKVRCDHEYLLLIKTFEDRIEGVKKALEARHSYEVPEFLVVPVVDGMKDYLGWMDEGTK